MTTVFSSMIHVFNNKLYEGKFYSEEEIELNIIHYIMKKINISTRPGREE